MVWDSAASAAKVYDDASVGEFALEGEYTVDGKKMPAGMGFALRKV
jgi:hypothetical protein